MKQVLLPNLEQFICICIEKFYTCNTVFVPKTGVKIHYSLCLISEERWWAQIFPACSIYDLLKFLKVMSAIIY